MRFRTFTRALSRLERAWAEADFLLSRRSLRDRERLKKRHLKRSEGALTLSQVFDRVTASPCQFCSRCCSKAAMDSGYYTHREREALLAVGVDIRQYIVQSWEEPLAEPEERCLFLKMDGCNIPPELRSNQCTGYVCHDRLGPRMVELNLAAPYKKARNKMLRAQRSLDKLPDVPLQKHVIDLGKG